MLRRSWFAPACAFALAVACDTPAHPIRFVEMEVTDLPAASQFYSAVFDWSIVYQDSSYAAFDAGSLTGGLRLSREVTPGGTLIVVYAEDLEAARERVLAHGGRLVREIGPSVDGRDFRFADPFGNELVAWTDQEGSVPVFTLRDSAGVEIADSREPAWPPGGAWVVAPEAMLRIGVLEGDPRYQFSGLTGAARLSDGTVVVADGGSQEVRFFDADGVFFRSVGRPGGGPGEFTGLSALGHGGGDTVWAYDFSLRRITWLDDRGDVARLTTLEPDPPILNPVGALPDGSLVLKQLWGAQRVAEATVTGLRRDPVAYVRFDTQGALLDTLGLFPGREVYITSEGGRGVMSTPPFARNSTGAIRDGGVVVGSQSAFELEEYGPEAELRRLMRIQGRDLVLRPGDLERFIEDRAEAVPPEQRPRLRTELAGMPVAETRPAYGELLADHSGNLWIAEWAPFPSLPGRWTVLAPDGRWLGDVAMPPDFYPWDIGEDWILGLERDEFDVEYMVLRAILKGGA